MAKGTSKSRSRTPGLTPQQRLFAHEVVRQKGNQTEAAIAAGYSARSARNQGARLMANEGIRTLVAELGQKALEKVDSKAEEVLTELHHVAMARLSRVIKLHPQDKYVSVSVKPLEEWTEHELAALTDVDVEKIFEGKGKDAEHVGDILKLKMRGKQAALETLAKHHGLLKEVVEHRGTVLVVDPYAQPPAAGASDARIPPSPDRAADVRQAVGERVMGAR